MPVRRILQLGDPILRTISTPADPAHTREVMQDLEDTLAEFRRTHGFGRGISAIQIGAAVRLIFLKVDDVRYELINPEYTWQSDQMFPLWDDCFSFPDLMVHLRRHQEIRIRYQDAAGAWIELGAEGALSELIQHEMDHLDGILAVDRAEGQHPLATREEWKRQY
ncbi:peptide deformylase [Paludibaculum fermentans]|uniref:peptide deformylase n=1 Tax=Paludibaculum fermentans TaxID=1473598 RepID=UPI003EBAF227